MYEKIVKLSEYQEYILSESVGSPTNIAKQQLLPIQLFSKIIRKRLVSFYAIKPKTIKFPSSERRLFSNKINLVLLIH